MTDASTHNLANRIAWQGLTIPVQADWRPLRIEGDDQKGAITIGDMTGPVFKLSWLRPPKGYDSKGWIDKRRKSTAGNQMSPNPPQPDSFERVSWVENLRIREESEKTVWWGCSKNDGVLVEVLLTNLREESINRWFLREALPNLTVVPKTQPWPWKIYSVHCEIPSEYRMTERRLATGDIAFQFARGKSSKLRLRQVFPASLALARRSFAGWLRDRVFNEHRRFRRAREDKPSDTEVKWSGRRQFPFPLGWLGPRTCLVLGLQDVDLDRLLIVEGEWRRGHSRAPVEEVMASMRGALE